MMPESVLRRTSDLRGQVLVDELVHRQNLEKALAAKCRECDYLYEQLNIAEGDVRNFREASRYFHDRLADSRHEVTRLKRQRRILASHLRALLYLARPSEATAFPVRQRAPEQPIIADWSDPAPTSPAALPPTLAERLLAWVRSFRQPRTSAA